MAHLPFEHLNLRRNPFGNLPESARVSVALVEVEWYREVLADCGVVVEVVGASGRGKTTHLSALRAGLDRAAYVEVDRGGATPALPDAPVVLVDEYQFLGADRRAALLDAADTLVLGTHESYREELESAGWEVETVELDREPSVGVEEFARERIEWARRGREPVPELADEAARRLREEYGTDLRAIEKHLYEVFQALDEPRTISVRDLEEVDLLPKRSEALRTRNDRRGGGGG